MNYPLNIEFQSILREVGSETSLDDAEQRYYNNDLQQKLADIIVKDSRFLGNKVLMLQGFEGASGFYPEFAQRLLFRRLLRTRDPDDVISWFIKVLHSPYADGKLNLAIWGVTVEGRIELADNVAIVPIGDLPDSPQKRSLQVVSRDSPITTSLHWFPPQSALVSPHRIEPLLFGPHDPTPQNDASAKRQLFSEIALALTLVGPRVVLQASQWFSWDDPDIAEAELGTASSRSFIEILPLQVIAYPKLDGQEAREIVQGYLGLNEPTRSKVRVALQRLSQSLRRQDPGDQAVELSIALETLMGDGQSEMTHKIKVRATRMIGGTSEDRQRISTIISRTYDIRSKLVHTGAVNSTKTVDICGIKLSNSDIVKEAIMICVKLIRKIINLTSIPVWNVFDVE